MRSRPTSSRVRYAAYVASGTSPHPGVGGESDPKGQKSARGRGFLTLLRRLWQELGRGRLTLVAALATLSVSTLLALILPSATKLAVDYAVLPNPGPQGLPDWAPLPRQPIALLWVIGVGMLVISALAVPEPEGVPDRCDALLERATRGREHATRRELEGSLVLLDLELDGHDLARFDFSGYITGNLSGDQPWETRSAAQFRTIARASPRRALSASR